MGSDKEFSELIIFYLYLIKLIMKRFFLAHENEVKNYLIENEGKILKDINKFTNTAPSYRCNLRIFVYNLGYSSYQSDYPFKMINKNGNILSSLYLTNKSRQKLYSIKKYFS